MGYPTALTAKTWGFDDVLFRSNPIIIAHPFSSYVIENILFKISFPAEFHAQTAVECAFKLHPVVKDRLDQIERVEIITHESALRIIDKKGPLNNPADRDHCLQYMTAIGLIFGQLTADDYEDKRAANPHIDSLRSKMIVHEDKQYTTDYLDPEKRSIANALQIFFKDGNKSDKMVIEYPLGHRRRRTEGIPVLKEKFAKNLSSHFSDEQTKQIVSVCNNIEQLESMPINKFIDLWTVDGK